MLTYNRNLNDQAHTRMMKRNLQGFTLLEMLLVLALVALIATSGLAAYQQRITRFKVEQTALQIQTIIEAAQAYNAANPAGWPTSDGIPTGTNQFQAYMPGAPLHYSPWYGASVQSYTAYAPAIGATPDANPCMNSSVAPVAQYYTINFTVPSSQANPAQIAQMIAARLPSATIPDPSQGQDPSHCAANTVMASAIPLPSPTPPPTPTESPVVSIQMFQLCPPGSTDPGCAIGVSGVDVALPSLSLVACPTGKFQKAYFTLMHFLDTTEDLGGPAATTVATKYSAFYAVGNLNPVCFPTSQSSITVNTQASSPSTLNPHQAKRTKFMMVETCVSSCAAS